MEINLPFRLYKYQAYSVQSLDNLKKRCLWFSKPSKFNDPFDCYIPYLLDEKMNIEWNPLYQQVKKIWESVKEEKDYKELAFLFQEEQPSEDFKKAYNQGFSLGWMKLIKDAFGNSGIACFSAKVDDVLMWSHYTNGHRGICLEFDTITPLFSSAKRVDYSPLLPSLSSGNSTFTLLENLALTKAINWSYEEEWRIFNNQGDVEIAFNPTALKGVYLGVEMSQTQCEIIASAISDLPRVNLYKMKRSFTEFKLDFEIVKNPYIK